MEKWNKVISFIMNSCSNLKEMNIIITFDNVIENNVMVFLTNFHKILTLYHEEIIPNIQKQNTEPLIVFELRSFIPIYQLEVFFMLVF